MTHPLGTAIDLVADLLDWEDTKSKALICHDLPPEFWDLWCDRKDELKADGLRVARDERDGHFFAVLHAGRGDLIKPREHPGELPRVTRFIRAPASLNIESPYLHPDQRDATWTLLQAIRGGVRFTLDASEAGIGKTWVALEVVKRLGINFGVVCPANIVTKWTDTAMGEPFELEPEFILSYEKLRSGRHGFAERGQQRKRTKFDWGTVAPVVLIFDEVHYCAGVSSLNSRLLHAAIDDPNVTCLTLSATVADSPLDLKTVGYGLGLHDYRGWWRWCLQHGCRPGPFGGLVFSTGDGTREPTPNQRRARIKLAEIHAQVFPRRGTRLTVRDSEVWRPKNLVMAELVDLPDHHGPQLKKALEVLAAKEDADLDRAEAKEMNVSSLTLNTRERQQAELLKVPTLVEWVKELRREGNSIVVFLNYRASIDLFEETCGQDSTRIVGGMSAGARDNVLKEFQGNFSQLCVVQSDAGAQSIDLDDVDGDHPRCALISPSYSAKRLYQALGRCYRPATTKSLVRQWLLFVAGTVEERVGRLVQVKLNAQALINDGDLTGVIQAAVK